jgi:hypothetical protein
MNKPYQPGDTILGSDNNFLGFFIDNLTDNLPGDDNEGEFEPLGEHKFFGNSLPFKYYGRRKVYNERFGSVNQLLVITIDKSLVWINI